jgi:YihY family inner membrane protein
MSSATLVPETWELTGDDAWETLKSTGRRRLLKDAFRRFRSADGFTHARSLAFLSSLVVVQGTIALVGLASALGTNRLSRGITTAIHNVVPGPAGRVLTDAVQQARDAGSSGQYVALTLGLIGTLITSTTAMGQLERGLNRIYGVEQDRPTVQKYGRAFLLAISAGTLVGLAFLAVGFGFAIGRAFDNDRLNDIWAIVRWPIAIGLMAAAMALLFKVCPRRRQPSWSWLAFGSSVSVVLWFAVTLAMGLVFRMSSSFGETYGPLAGIVALQLWALLSSIAIFFGGAVAAQLEAVRAGTPEPQDAEKLAESEPSAGERRPVLTS